MPELQTWMTELDRLIGSDVRMALLQAAGAVGLCAIVVLLCRRYAVRVEREATVSIARGAVQMVLVGMVLAALLHGNLLIGSLILMAMTVNAAFTVAGRLKGMVGALMLTFWAIAAGSGTVIAVMLATRSLKPDISMLVPVGSMIIANAMNACGQAVERFKAEIVAHVGQIEAGLSLGAEPAVTVAPCVQSAVYASLLPRLDMMKSLGLVWIPGVMAGMMVSGANPIYAGIYQFIVVAMIFAASGLTGLTATVLMQSRVFSPAAQLTLRSADGTQGSESKLTG